MLPKIPHLKRENASLRHPREKDTSASTPPDQPREVQKIPQTPQIVSAKVWWNEQKKDPQHNQPQEEKRNAQLD